MAIVALGAAACATGGARLPAAPPSYQPAAGQPASERARLYAACVREAITADRFDIERNLIRFHCQGQPAAMLNASFMTWAAAGGATHVDNGTRYVLSAPIERDLYGVDYCTSVAYNGDQPRCTIVMNGGAFLATP